LCYVNKIIVFVLLFDINDGQYICDQQDENAELQTLQELGLGYRAAVTLNSHYKSVQHLVNDICCWCLSAFQTFHTFIICLEGGLGQMFVFFKYS